MVFASVLSGLNIDSLLWCAQQGCVREQHFQRKGQGCLRLRQGRCLSRPRYSRPRPNLFQAKATYSCPQGVPRVEISLWWSCPRRRVPLPLRWTAGNARRDGFQHCRFDSPPRFAYWSPTISNLLQHHEPTRSLRSSSSHYLSVPRHNLKFGSRAFRFSAPRVWNSLPVSIRESQSLPTFRRYLKTLYFQSAYPLSAAHLT